MSWLVYGLLVLALVVLGAAEWPRLQRRLVAGRSPSFRTRRAHRRWRKRSHLTLVQDDDLSEGLDEEREAFAESVARDLERLPTIDDRD
jgi:hypothetical protein